MIATLRMSLRVAMRAQHRTSEFGRLLTRGEVAHAPTTWEVSMKLGAVLIRGVVGPLFVGHGTQKLFGWFGGHGIEGTGGYFEKLGLRPGRRHAKTAGAAETVGGTMIALGLLTPAAAATIIGTMVTA